MELNFDKLSIVKRRIIRTTHQRGWITGTTYPKEKQWLSERGWLCVRQYGHLIINGQWALTDAGLRAFLTHLAEMDERIQRTLQNSSTNNTQRG